ncbi:DUF4230 domain-containing protein [Lawsonibacter sp. LCP25S3_G6]|uniref:DUF4230 domain-containing protein n=1 Tax=unclassified Lawsonibacter TaxID=2617946 RepID=UPI003F99AE24
MVKVWKTASSAIAALLAIVLIFGSGYLLGKYYGNRGEVFEEKDSGGFDLKLPGEQEVRVVTVDEVEMRLVEIGQLSTYSGEYSVTKSADFTRHIIDNIAIPGTTNTIRIECQGLVKVGYDMESITPTVDNESQKIYIALPEAKVLDNYIIWDTVNCSENNTILNPIDFSQYQTLISEIEAQGLAQAENDGIYDKAEEHIKFLVQTFLSGFDEYTIVFL